VVVPGICNSLVTKKYGTRQLIIDVSFRHVYRYESMKKKNMSLDFSKVNSLFMGAERNYNSETVSL
jgi:hypothetical protein